MHCHIFFKIFFTGLFLFSTAYKVHAQNITNMQIGVSPEALTILKFNSRISHVEFGNKDYYTTQVRDDDNSLVIKVMADSADTTNLYVTEGSRGHLFNVVFLTGVDFNKVRFYYDFSDLKKLQKLVDDLNEGDTTDIIPSHRGSVATPDTGISYEEEVLAEHIKDSTAAAEAKKREAEEKERLAKARADSIQAQRAEEARIAKAKADAEAARKAEELRLAKAQADAEAARKAEELQLAKAQAEAEAVQKAEEIRLVKEKAATEAARKEEEQRLANAKVDSIQKVERERILQAKLDSIQAQKERNTLQAKMKLDSIQVQKERNALLTKMKLDSISARREENARLAKSRLDSIQAEKEEALRIAAVTKKKTEDSLAALPKFYSHEELWRKYPKLIFELPPVGQYLAGDYAIPGDTMENARVSYLILQETPKIQQASDTVNNINFVLQGIYFSTTNCYMRILIQNKSTDDYLVGPINLKWYADSGKIYNAYPCFITSYPSQGIRTSFPVLAQGNEETIVLTTRALNIKESHTLDLSIGDRLGQVNLDLVLPGKEYLSAMEKTK